MTDATRRATAWQTAIVVDVRRETERVKTFRLALERPTPFRAGQHYVVRLSAPDGYTASRSYSVASAPDGSGEIELTVERNASGRVDFVAAKGNGRTTQISGSEMRSALGLRSTWFRIEKR